MLGKIARSLHKNAALEDLFMDRDDIAIGDRRLLFSHAFAQRDEFGDEDLEQVADALGRHPFVFLSRDPRAVLCSYFHERTKRSFEGKYETPSSLDAFARRDDIGLMRILNFYNIWAKRFPDDFRGLFRYEDLHANPLDIVANISVLVFGSAPPDDVLSGIIDAAAFEKMQLMERENSRQQEPLKRSKRLVAYDPADPDSYKVRKGRIDSFKEELSPETNEYAVAMIRRHLSPVFGYPWEGRPQYEIEDQGA